MQIIYLTSFKAYNDHTNNSLHIKNNMQFTLKYFSISFNFLNILKNMFSMPFKIDFNPLM